MTTNLSTCKLLAPRVLYKFVRFKISQSEITSLYMDALLVMFSEWEFTKTEKQVVLDERDLNVCMISQQVKLSHS